jgi:hypothetical protein
VIDLVEEAGIVFLVSRDLGMSNDRVAMILEVVYPGGERCAAVGYPVPGSTLIVDIIPRGPEAAYRDEVEVDFETGPPYPVRRVVAGPRRPTIRVGHRLAQPECDRWIEAREAEGWELREADDDPAEVWVVAGHGMDVAQLERAGGVIRS